MTRSKARYEITVEGDSYSITEWEEKIGEIVDSNLDVTVESCDIIEK